MHIDGPGVPTRAIIYCRISRDREGAGLGIERQREDCVALAQQLGVEVVAFYPDNDLSAYSGKPRPGYQKLLADLREGRADTVLAWHTDRLHRSPAELEEYIDVCEPRGVQTRTVKAGHLDLTTATGRMIARQLGVQARYEVERMIERQRRKRDEMAQKGQYFGGRRPFGYEPDGVMPRTVICLACGVDDPAGFRTVIKCQECGAGDQFDEWTCTACKAPRGRHVWPQCQKCGTAAAVAPDSEFERIRQATDAILAGTSLRSIAAEWDATGVLTSTGGQWEGPEVRSMLLRPRNAGIIKHRGKEAGPAGWPAPLDEPTWRSLVAFLTDDSRRVTTSPERKYLGSGLYLCGVCDDGMTMRGATSNRGGDGGHLPAYTCRLKKHVNRKMEPLDDYVVTELLARLEREDAADLLAERQDPVDVRGAQSTIRSARQMLDGLAQALGEGEMTLPEWRTASKAARERLERAEGELSRAVEVNPAAGLVGAADIVAAWNGLDLSRQRAVIAHLVTVKVHRARHGRLPGGGYFDADSVELVWKG
ncbi:MAG: recombinase family protein [Streptomyces sp.]|jgi:DNA invertase Pin-like site-specific DNA recombinase|nr:recombinase family protein [Streptomyces sp.]